MFHKVKEVYALPDLRLSVVFADGLTKTYDVNPLLHRFAAFKPLKDEALFAGVQVDAGGYGVAWSDDIDLSCDELWQNGITEKTPF